MHICDKLDRRDELYEKRRREQCQDGWVDLMRKRYRDSRPDIYKGHWMDGLHDWEKYIQEELCVSRYHEISAIGIGLWITPDDMLKLKRALVEMPYHQFLKTHYWAVVSGVVKARANVCEQCGEVFGLQVHHKTYEHHGEEHSHMDDLQCLCRLCHGAKHSTMEDAQ